MEFRVSRHAEDQMARRGISASTLDAVLRAPDQLVTEAGGRKVYQSRVDFGGRIFLVRAIVETRVDPPVVLTVYRTSRISKYWRSG